jgi:tetratricopeptide (TPR) repeat protein
MTAITRSLETAVFAGRATELSALKEGVRAADSGRASIVMISGEPGIGKTRLTDEACQYSRELGFVVVAGHCFDTQSTVSYYPFIQAFRQLGSSAKEEMGRVRDERETERAKRKLQVEEPDKRNEKRLRPRRSPLLADNSGTLHDSSNERTRAGRRGGPRGACDVAGIIARLACPPPHSGRLSPGPCSGEQTRLFESIVCFLQALSRNRPLVVVLEDLHWADQGSLSLLVHIVRTVAAARLLIIVTCRAGDAAHGTDLRRTIAELARNPSYQRIRLNGLAETETAELMHQLLGQHSSEEIKSLAANISRLTNGNPLFIHEVVRQLIETGRLSIQDGQWVMCSGWESKIAAEDGVLELVDTRLSRLSGRCRDALAHAAVLGEEFELEVLASMLQGSAQELTVLLEEARTATILTEAHGDESADYAFTHSLIRQSLYERLSRPAKRARHAAAAHAIESVHHPDLDSRLPQLAMHYARAETASGRARAVEYCMRAGEMAYAVCAYADAACHWRAALGLARANDKRMRAQLLERIGEACLLSSPSPEEAARQLRSALKLYSEIGGEHDIARVHARLVTVLSIPATINVGQAVSHSRRAEKLLAGRPDRASEGKLLIGEAIVAHAQFRTADGLAASAQAMEIGSLLDNAEIWSQAAALHGHFLWASGKLAAGLALMEQALERAARAPDPLLTAAWLLSFSYLILWDPASAERTIRPAIDDYEASQAEFLHQILVAHLGIAHTLTGALAGARSILAVAPHRFLEAALRFFEGEWNQAEELLSQQIDRSQGAQSKQQHWTASFWLGRLKRVQGDYERAFEILANTPLMTERLLRIPEEIVTRTELALTRLARGEVAEARSEVLRCRSLLTPGEDWRALAAFVDRADAAVLAQDGLLEDAGQRFMAAGKLFSQYRVPWEVAETLVVWGTLLLRQSKTEGGAEKLNGALQIYKHLGLGARWQSRIEALPAPAITPSAPPLDALPVSSTQRETTVQSRALPPASGIYSLVTTNDVALLATLIHDAIAHLMNAIDKAAKLRVPIERIAAATERIGKISTPVDRLVRALEQATRNSLSGPPRRSGQRIRPGRTRKLNRSHDPGRPL